jgi:hypothetical protein
MSGVDQQLAILHCSQLAITFQHSSAGIADVKAMARQGGSALEEIAPGHSTGAVAKPGSGGATRSQIVRVKRNSGCSRKAQQENHS